jgi:hypothetical protein
MDDLIGFNSDIENKVLLVLNEARNAGDNRFANYDKLKAFITDPYIDIAEKYVRKHTVDNVLNMIFTTPNDYPVKIDNGDRRYFVLDVNGKYKHDKSYFNEYWKACSGQTFFDNLLTFYMQLPTTFNEVRDPPMTVEKQDIIDASRTPVERFIMDHYDQFVEGWETDEVKSARPEECTSEKAFILAITGKCKRERRRVPNSTTRPYFYVLKPEWHEYFKPEGYDERVAAMGPA